jgi:hypothetical protein
MVMKVTNALNCKKVSHMINILWLLHVSAPLVAISREMHYKNGHIKKLQTFVNQQTEVKY